MHLFNGCSQSVDTISSKGSNTDNSKRNFLNFSHTFERISFGSFFFLIPVYISILMPNALRAQSYEMEFNRISIKRGLSQSSIFAIIQDQKGFLWFGTQDGLNRFDGYNFKVYKHNPLDSLSISDSWINSLCEDSEGNIWVGTSGGGLNKFDPIREIFIPYQQKVDDQKKQEYNRVQVVFEDSEGKLWIGTEGGGLSLLNKVTGNFTNFVHNKNENTSLSDDQVKALLEDKNGSLWIGTLKGGLSVLKKNQKEKGVFQRFLHNPDDPRTLSSNHILSLFEDSSGKLWVGTDNGLNLYDPVNNQFYRFMHNPYDEYSLSNNIIYSFYEDQNNILWIGTEYGLNFYDRSSDRFWQINHDPSNPNSLSNDLIRTIFKDASGSVWVGTYGGGLNQYNWRKNKFRHYKNMANRRGTINDNNVWSIVVARSGHLWVGTNKGLNKVNRKRHSVRYFRHNPADSCSLSDDIVRVIYEDKKGDLWFGTNNGGLNKFNPLKKKFIRHIHNPEDSLTISHNTIRAILEDENGSLWIGTWGGLNLFDPKNGNFTYFVHNPNDSLSISDNRVRCLLEDNQGILWVGTYKGLNKFDREKGIFTHYMYNPDDPTSLSHDRVLTMHQDKKGTIWIGTYGGGLNKFDPVDGKFHVYTEKDGLANDAIYGILEDQNGNLWMSTNKGISKFNPVDESFNNFNANDGLQSDEFNGGAFAKSAQGEMFFGGINGYNSFLPETIVENTYIPPVVLTSFRVFDKEIDMDTSIANIKNISLSYRENFFAFEFAALDYSSPEKNKYTYKLEGFDRDWVKSGHRRYANYTNLDGGEYTFIVKGSNSDGVWNQAGSAIKIYIDPPIWATWWFRILAVLLISSIGYSAYYYRVKKIEKQKGYLEEQIAERTWEINERNKQLITAKKETDDILHNVAEGIFLINSKYEIKSQHSAALSQILEEEKPARKNFIELLENKVTHKVHTTIREFVELMFDNSVDEATIIDLNPMSEIKLTFENKDGKRRKTKHLSFKVKRISDDQDKAKELIITVNDLSDQIRLAKELEETQEYGKKQMEWMLSILHIEPQLIKEFMEGVRIELKYIDSVLRESEKEKDFSITVEKIFRSMHMIKGNAALVDMKFFVEKAHEFEEYIEHIKTKGSLSGSDFVPLVLMLKEMRSILTSLDNVVERISEIHMNFRPKRSYENKLFITSLENLINSLSRDLNKKIKFIYNEFDAGAIPYRYRLTTRQILIQLIRNSVYHGIEEPEERELNGKDPSGRIEIVSYVRDNEFSFRMVDDGRGIQVDKLRKKALASGTWNKKEIENWTDEEVAEIIFNTGISTLDKANLVAGRGVGMDSVKEKVTSAGGEISINFERGKFCEFEITVPIQTGKTMVVPEEEIVDVG